jgi:PAS domain S-box-containing protein
VLDVLRQSGATAHVIVLSGSAEEADRVEALQRGADDFVVKPVFVKELTSRVLSVRRRGDPERDATVRLANCEIDLRARRVTRAGQVIDLTTMEFDLLAYLAVRPGHVFNRDQLLNAVWHSAPEWQQPATVTEHIRRLRNKIEVDPGRPTTLVTVRGSGYRLDLRATSRRPAVERLPEPGVIVHVHGRIVFADDALGALVAVSDPATLVGTQVLELAAPGSQAAAAARLADVEAGRLHRSEILQLRRADGQHLTVAVRSAPTHWHGQQARRVEFTAVSEGPARLHRMVTGVLADVADAVIVTDLNFHIRSWNSAAERIYGWAEEKVLGRHVLDVLRWVGDEGHLAQAWDHLERTGRWNGTGVQVTRDGSTVEVLATMTVLRAEGGEPIGVVSVNRLVEVAGRARMRELDSAMADRIKQGIVDDEFVVHYQPIVGLDDGHLVTVEALVRWEHPERGTLPPAAFLDAAERSGAIVDLGDFVIDRACREAAAWRRSGADIRLSVNVSTRQLADERLAGRFTDILRASEFDPACLWLEVTETAIVEELDRAARALHALVALGVGVSIDDFGTGWASLTYLKNFPVHALKIDGSFVAGVGHDGYATAIVRSILSLGAELDLFVVAEGIETQEQHDRLKAMGCTLGQGYLYGRPSPADDVAIERARRIPDRVATGVPAHQHYS